jgi:hypothetical protein
MRTPDNSHMRDEYDFSGGVRSKHYKAYLDLPSFRNAVDRDASAPKSDVVKTEQTPMLE